MKFVNGKKIADEILEGLKERIASLDRRPKLVVFLAGENSASLSYIKMKQKRAEEIGAQVEIRRYPAGVDDAKLGEEIERANNEKSVSGIIVQLPLPKHINRDKILNTVDPRLDVDCLTEANKIRLNTGEPYFLPPAAAAVLKILEYYNIALHDKNILLVGSGDLIGKPLAAILHSRQIDFHLANRQTEDLTELTLKADIIITGAGQPGLITGQMIKPDSVIIDAGTTGSDDGQIVGDVDGQSVMGKAALLAPVPGGVGPITVAMLLSNVMKADKFTDR